MSSRRLSLGWSQNAIGSLRTLCVCSSLPFPPSLVFDSFHAVHSQTLIQGPITIVVKVPTIPDTPFPLNGQVLQISIKVSEIVKALKEKVGEQLQGMAPNKQKLQLAPFGVLNDNKTLAFYNLQEGVEIDLGLKERGGRKK